MPRSVKEWIGKTDDSPVPPRVRLRVLNRFNQCCASCGRKIVSGMRWTCDHILALILGGQNRERNLQPLCGWCDPAKTARDQADKSKVADVRLANFGQRKRKSRPIPGSKASGWRKPMNGPAERRQP